MSFMKMGVLRDIEPAKNAAYFGYNNPWTGFQNQASGRSDDLREGWLIQMQEDSNYWLARASNAIALGMQFPDQEIGSVFVAEGTALKERIEELQPLVSRINDFDLVGLLGFREKQYHVSEADIEKLFKELNLLFAKVQTLNWNLQEISGGMSVISREAAERARQSVGELSPQEKEEILAKAGMFADEQYIALIEQQYFMTKLVEAYSQNIGDMGPDVMGFIKQRLEENEKMIEESKPTVTDATSDAVVGVYIDLQEKVKSAIPKLPVFDWGGTLKWVAMVGGTIAIGAAVLMGAGFKALTKGARHAR